MPALSGEPSRFFVVILLHLRFAFAGLKDKGLSRFYLGRLLSGIILFSSARCLSPVRIWQAAAEVTAGLPRSCACGIHLIPEYLLAELSGARSLHPDLLLRAHHLSQQDGLDKCYMPRQEGRQGSALQDTGLYES
jgi:hypothetical protein